MILTLKEAFDPVFDTQRVFRSLLDCMARPGKVNFLPDVKVYIGKDYSFPFLIARTLLDTEVSFACPGIDRNSFGQEVMRCTGSKLVDTQRADFIFCDGREKQNTLLSANSGDIESPDLGATVIMMVDHLYGQKPPGLLSAVNLDLTGPGVDGSSQIWLSGIHYSNLDWLLLRNKTYPLGVDTILVDREGKVSCIPRSGKLLWRVDPDGLRCS